MLPASQRFPAALADRQPVKPAASLWEVVELCLRYPADSIVYMKILGSTFV